MFRNPDGVAHVIERLGAAGVPVDEVEVFVVDGAGKPARKIAVHQESGTLKGALWGGLVGACVGMVAALLAMLGSFGNFGSAGPEGFFPSPLLGLLGWTGASMAMGVPIGAVIGMGRWQGAREVPSRHPDGGGVMVLIRTAELRDRARRILLDCGAEDVSA
jgi:hypothetical protein